MLRVFMLISIALTRLVITFILALVFGIERQSAHKPIGFGTFTFVSVGSCALAITAISISTENPMPLLAAIVTGIGFLGAGAMIKTTDKIFGVTTAASIWTFAILGLVVGIGEYEIAAAVYFLIWFVIIIDRNLEKRGIGSYQKKIIITTNKLIEEKLIRDIISNSTKKYKLIGVDINKKENKLSIVYLIEGKKEDINKIPDKLFKNIWFSSCKIE